MAEQSNLFGAVIFWLYIVFALLFTFFVIESILKSPKPAPHKHVATFSILALISFSTLSFNMLHVLIDSYSTWSERQVSPLSVSPSSVWQWSITSTLFRNFGEAIVQDNARYLWTQSALMATMSVSFFMGAEGLRARVPRLWAFFALSQILPISFALNLFYVALLRSPNDRKSPMAISRNSTLGVLTAYCVCLLVAPYSAEGPYLMPTILAARMLLLVPLFLPKVLETRRDQPSTRLGKLFTQYQAQVAIAAFTTIMTIKQVIFVAIHGVSITNVLMALISHPAVTSLGFDFLVTAASFAIWCLILDHSGLRSIGELKKES